MTETFNDIKDPKTRRNRRNDGMNGSQRPLAQDSSQWLGNPRQLYGRKDIEPNTDSTQ